MQYYRTFRLHFYIDPLIQMTRLVELWREMYKQFDCHTSMKLTVKSNEIFADVVVTVQSCLERNTSVASYLFAADCLETLVATLHCNLFLGEISCTFCVQLGVLRGLSVSLSMFQCPRESRQSFVS